MLEQNSRLKERYLVVRVMRIGGLSAIYEARDMRTPNLTQARTIKETVLDEQQAIAATPEWVEARRRLLLRLEFPVLCRTYDYFRQGGCLYQIAEYIRGRDLEDVLDGGKNTPPVEAIHAWAIDLAGALHYLHTHPHGPIVYRDVKPSNIMVDQRLRVRLIDFDTLGVFPTGMTDDPIGTDGYAAPEQYEGAITPLIDIYGLGATLHHLLTGIDPRLGIPFAASAIAVRKYNPRVSKDFDRIIRRALSHNPEDRFISASSMGQALRSIDPVARDAMPHTR